MKQLTTSTKQRLFITSLLLLIYSLTVFSQNRYKVTCQKLNVRSAPTQKSQVLGTLVEGDIISVENINNGWAKIDYKGKTSYISSTYIEKIDKVVNTNTQTNKSFNIQKVKEQPIITTVSKKQNTDKTNRTALWHFSIGGMPQTDIFDKTKFNLFAQLGGDIPVKIGNTPFTIETGLRYLNKPSAIVIGDYYDYYTDNASLLEIPIRLGYDLPLSKDFAIRLGAGPYLSYMLNNGGGFQFGLEPVVALKYKDFSIGVQYSAPIVKGYTDETNNTLMLALTIRFKSKAWKNIGTGLIVAGTTAAIVGSVVSSQNSNSDNIGIADIDDDMDISGEIQNGEEMILLSDLARKLQSEINTMEQEIAQKTRSSNIQTTKTRNIRGRQVKNTSKITSSSNSNKSIEVRAKEVVIREWQQRLKWVQARQMRGETYISKTEWDNYIGKRTKREEEQREQRKKQRQERNSDRMQRLSYNQYVDMLQSAHYFPEHNERTLENRIKIQKTMRELRAKYNLQKSPWEDWDGVPGSMR